MMSFNGMQMGLGTLMKLSDAETRSVTAENVYGEKGRGGMAEVNVAQPEVTRIGQKWSAMQGSHPSRELGRKWKVRPCIDLPGASTTTIMDVEGPGVIQHIWITVSPAFYRDLILRMYWDGEETPSVEAPLGDFFCNGWNQSANISAIPINVNPTGAFNCYFAMPFRRHARITVENRSKDDCDSFFYTVNYALTEVGDDDAYFHAQFRRVSRLPDKTDYTILDGVKGNGHYVGTYMAWQQFSPSWWGEGEIKFFMDGDREFPTICGTGTEDYFGGAWCFGENYSAPFLGYPSGLSDGAPGNRHSLYRFHVMDPIRFKEDLRVTMQALGFKGGQYVHLQDDIASVAYWYQTEPHGAFPELQDRKALEVSDGHPWQTGFVMSWKMSPPMAEKVGVEGVPPPPRDGEWLLIQAASTGVVEPQRFAGNADGLAYLATTIEADADGVWTLLLGHDEAVRVFLDGTPVLTELSLGPTVASDRSKVNLRLPKGRHDLAIALNVGKAKGIRARFELPAADRQPGVPPLPRFDSPEIFGDFSLWNEAVAFAGGLRKSDPLIPLSDLKMIPSSIEVNGKKLTASRLSFSGDALDLAPLVGTESGGAAYVYLPFEVEAASRVSLAFAADWWLDAFVDGRQVFTTGNGGNGRGSRLEEVAHVVHFDATQGGHVLCLRFARGIKSALLRLAGPADLRKMQAGLGK